MMAPFRIGLTGNIATGKSTVGGMLVDLGAELIDADRLVHAALLPDGVAYTPVVAEFGPAILTPNGCIDRRLLGARVFSDAEALARLESLVHPPVIAAVQDRIAASHTPVVVVEAIKLLESGLAEEYESIWVTTCTPTTQAARLIAARGLSEAEAWRRIQAQSAQEAKIARADVLIVTDGALPDTLAQVQQAWARILQAKDYVAIDR